MARIRVLDRWTDEYEYYNGEPVEETLPGFLAKALNIDVEVVER